jgi:hypothetical protein
VWSVTTATLPNNRILIISGGDWSLMMWPVRSTGQIAGEITPPPVTDAVSRTDDTDESSFRDVLGRGVLAAHLEELLVQLTGKQRAGTAVVHIDGRWGSGKSRLVTLLEQRMASAPTQGESRLRQPLVVRYDAWRESAVAPEWWSVATAINRAVRGERAVAARVAMTLINTVTRVARSVPVVIGAALLAAIVVARLSGLWSGNIQALGTALTVLTAVATVGLAAGRVFFWSAPAFGRLHLRAEDNPLGEVAAIVASLRRWSPREGSGQRLADTCLAVGGLAALAWLTGMVLSVPALRGDLTTAWEQLGEHEPPVVAALVASLLVGGAWLGRPRHHRSWPAGDQPRRPARIVRAVKMAGRLRRSRRPSAGPAEAPPRRSSLRRLGAVVVTAAAGVGAYLVFAMPMPSRLGQWVRQDPYPWAVAPVLVLAAAGAAWAASRGHRPRRPLLLVIDDLDRCPAERVVKLLETVHTLLRERPDVRVFPRWRCAAALVVLVLGDGRWVRCSFEKVYGDFQRLGSDVHGLGADFLQKVFDHVVLVPALSADQVQTYVDDVTEVSSWAITGRRARATATPPTLAHPRDAARTLEPEKPHAPRRPEPDPIADPALPARESPSDAAPALPDDPATAQAEALIASTTPGQVHGPQVREAIEQAPQQDQQRLAEEVAAKAASKEAIAAFSEHLLARYTPLMPANPRLVARVANTFGMLMALGLHVGHHEPQDYVARAAIIFVRFPALVDQLLSDPDPPVIDPAGSTGVSHNADASATGRLSWSRRDVQQVLRDEQGQLIDIVRLARCFGREYPPPIPSPQSPQPTTFSAVSPEADGATNRLTPPHQL